MTKTYKFKPEPIVTVPIEGEDAVYPVHRIFCVGRNYEAHAIEMGLNPQRDQMFFFTKTPNTLCIAPCDVAYPPMTSDYHYEMELVIAIGQEAWQVPVETALDAVYAHACGLDMTRRDLQLTARQKSLPWDAGKDFEQAAVTMPLVPASKTGQLTSGRIALEVNGEVKQDADLSQMIWNTAEIIADLSQYYHLRPGDLIFTGTPAGVGPVVRGDKIRGIVEGLPDLTCAII